MKENTKNWISEISLKLVLVSGLFVACVFIFSLIADEIVLENEDWFDSAAFHFFAARSTPAFISVMHVLTFFGSTRFFLPAYIFLVGFCYFTGRKNDAVDIAVVAISSTALLFGLKWVFHRHRPDYPLFKTLHSYSFPSGHALCSFIFCSILIYLIWKSNWPKWAMWIAAILLILFSISIGISRIVLRYHYASDVVAAFFLGIAWVLFSLWLQHRLTRSK